MVNLEKLLKEIKIKTIQSETASFTLWSYYLGLGDFERITNDTKTYKKGNQTIYEKYLPIIALEDRPRIEEFRLNV